MSTTYSYMLNIQLGLYTFVCVYIAICLSACMLAMLVLLIKPCPNFLVYFVFAPMQEVVTKGEIS